MRWEMLSTRTLRWISVVVPTIFVVAFELITRSLYSGSVSAWTHTVVVLASVSVAAFLFSTFVFASMGHMERQIRERNKRLALLNAVSSEVSESLDLEEVATVTIRNAVQALNATAGGLMLVSEDDGELRLIAQENLHSTGMNGHGGAGPFDCECGTALSHGRPTIVVDTGESSSCAGVLGAKPGTCLTTPIKVKGRNVGAIFLARPKSRPFEPDEVSLVSALAAQVGPALQNAQLFSKSGAIAMLQERQHVAREVHDGLAQTLGYLNVQMGIVDHFLGQGELGKAQAELESMTLVTQEAYADLRHSITDLRTPVSASGLRRTLREHAERFSRDTGITVHFEGHKGVAASIAPEKEVQILRIVQEALTNVKKHAPGAQIRLSVDANDRRVLVTVRDDGPGFEPASITQNGRFGLQTMKERAESAGGKLVVDSQPGAGTTVEVTVPVVGA